MAPLDAALHVVPDIDEEPTPASLLKFYNEIGDYIIPSHDCYVQKLASMVQAIRDEDYADTLENLRNIIPLDALFALKLRKDPSQTLDKVTRILLH